MFIFAIYFFSVLACLPRLAYGDLEEQLYRSAKSSEFMTDLSRESLDEFLLDPREEYLLVFFHVGTCHICKSTLPLLNDLAKEFLEKDVPVAVGHVDCTSSQEYWKRRFNLKGFPHLALWHRGEAQFSEKAARLKELSLDTGTGSRGMVRIIEAKDELLDAARQAFMSLANDENRLRGLGRDAEVVQIEYDDFTAKLRVKSVSNNLVWYPLEALLLPDGSAAMAFKRPSKPRWYRPTSWKLQPMRDFLERMMRPSVLPLKSSEQLKSELKDEQLVALILCGESLDSSPGFELLANTWQDKHRAYFTTSKKKCPIDGDWPLVISFSSEHLQWHPLGKPVAAAAVAGPSIAARSETDALSTWFERHRFPGLWKVGYESFHPLLHAGRDVAMVAIDEYKDDENKKIYKIIRDVVRPAMRASPNVYTYDDNSTYWGVVDGRLTGLDTFGIYTFELPRVVIFEVETNQWVEDERELSIWNLKYGLANAHNLVRYGEGPKGFMMKHFYKPLLLYDRMANDAGGMQGRIALHGVLILGALYCFWSLSKSCMTIYQQLMAGDDEEEVKLAKKD